MVALGVGAMVVRYVGLQAIVPFTLSIMSDIARDAFGRVQRFSTDWHANTFAGSTVRKVTRGMWAVDILNDTLMMALLPSFVVLVGSMVILGLHWPLLGVIVGMRRGRLCRDDGVAVGQLYRARGAALQRLGQPHRRRTGRCASPATRWSSPSATRTREDARLAGVIGKWRKRVRRTWYRYNTVATSQTAVLWIMRSAVIGGALMFWLEGSVSPGDVTYVLSMSLIIHAYLRDVGQHINHLQRAVNDMEELVAIHDEAIGIADAADAKPLVVAGGGIAFDEVTFHYRGHATPLYDRLSVAIRPGERVGLVGRSGSRQDHLRQAGAASLRRHRRPRHDRRSGRLAGDAALAAQPDRARRSRSRSCSTARWPRTSPMAGRARRRRRSSRRRISPTRTTSSRSCRGATARWSASAASSCRAASVSAWRWRAPSWPTRRS